MLLHNAVIIMIASVKALLITCIILAIIWIIYALYIIFNRRRYAHIPKPEYNHFIFGHALELNKLNNQYHLSNWTRYCGSIFCIFIFHKVLLIVTKPDLVKEILTNPIYIKDPGYYKYFRKLAGVTFLGNSLFTNLNNEDYKFKRQYIAPFFYKGFMRQKSLIVNTIANELTELLNVSIQSNSMVKITNVLQAAVVDMLWRVAFSKNISECGQSDSINVYQTMKIIFNFLSRVWNNPFYEMLPWNYAECRKVNSMLSGLRNTVRCVLMDRIGLVDSGQFTPDDVLDSLVRNLAPVCSYEELVDELILLLSTVTENIASMVAFCLLELGKHPNCKLDLLAEIDTISCRSNKDKISEEDLQTLPLLNACIEETLRLYPPIPHTCRISPSSGDCYLGSLSVPAKTSILVSILGIHYTQHKNAFDFMPERFLNPDTARNFAAESFAFIPFSSGIRSCVGQGYAISSAKVLLIRFLENFDYDVDPYESFSFAESVRLKPASHCKISIRKRSK